MLSTVHIMNIILPILYAFTFGAYWYDFTKEKKNLSNSKRIFLFVTVLLHVFYLLARTIEFNHTPITSKFEIFTVLAFCIAFSYFILELLTDIRGTGLFIILFSLIFQLLSSIFIEDLVEVSEVLRIPKNITEAPPEMVSGLDSEYITAVGKLEDRLLILLDLEKVLSTQQRTELAEV